MCNMIEGVYEQKCGENLRNVLTGGGGHILQNITL